MSSTPERGRTGVLLPNEARAPTKPKNRNEPMIPIMKRPQITANVILIKSFMLSKYLFVNVPFHGAGCTVCIGLRPTQR